MSSSGPRGLLYVEMDCPPELEEEFHAWYNTEHLPERLGFPGFIRASRYGALIGAPRWLATYELESVAALETAEYMAHYGDFQSPWTKRVTSLVQVHRRVYEAAWSGTASREPGADGAAQGLLAVRYTASPERLSKINVWHDTEYAPGLLHLPGVLSARRLRNTEPASDGECLALYELGSPWVTQSLEFIQAWKAGWETKRSALSEFHRIVYIRIDDGR